MEKYLASLDTVDLILLTLFVLPIAAGLAGWGLGWLVWIGLQSAVGAALLKFAAGLTGLGIAVAVSTMD